MKVKIVRRPVGEAPEWVRDAWIGLSLPLATKRKREWAAVGVLGGPSNVFCQLWAVSRGKSFGLSGYAVHAKTAVDLLSEVKPDAAKWWREQTPRLLTGSRRFVFDAAACEPVHEAE